MSEEWNTITEESPDVETFGGDGKRMLVWVPKADDQPCVMSFVYNGDYWAWYRESGWAVSGDDEVIPEDGDLMPTHWMELPSAPLRN